MIHFKKIFLLFILTFSLSIYSCNKEEAIETILKEEIDKKNYINSFKICNQDKESLINLAENQDEKRINEITERIGIILKEFIKQDTYSSFILEEAEKSSVDAVTLSDFLANFPEIKEEIGNVLANENTSLSTLSEELKYKGVNYNLVFNVPNILAIDKDIPVIFSTGLELNSDIDETLENYISAWYYENNEEYDIAIGEEHLKNETPLIVLDILSDYNLSVINDRNARIINTNVRDEENEKWIANSRMNLSANSYEYRLDERFENSGKSEFFFMVLILNPDGVTTHYLGGDNGAVKGNIADVHKDDIGNSTVLKKWRRWFPEPISGSEVIFNTYEKDWHRAIKILGELDKTDGTSEFFFSARRFDTDCYWKDNVANNTNSTNTIDLNQLFGTVNATKVFWGNNGNIKLWRIQN